MPAKVSVIVPTYAPGDRIDGLVRSLEAQTMPAEDFEVIFVDDGSPDGTWRRLKRIRRTHPNVRITRIPNSGWPSRPRNVGLDLARGEYVLFMDHDDELYPRALEAGYAMAARTGADVLNGKETRTDQPGWSLGVYAANSDNAIDRDDVHPLIPTNPHKLFRRALLTEHGIRFPEGRRVLWEDVFFALDVARYAEVIAVMADTPFYHWVRGGTTASSSYSKDRQEYFRWVREIVLRTNATLGPDNWAERPELAGQWRLMLTHQYRSRILAQLGKPLFAAPAAEVAAVRAAATNLVLDHVPEELDDDLTPTQRGRAALVRTGRWDLLERLVKVDAGLAGTAATTSVGWVDGTLRIRTETRWLSGAGRRPALRYDGDRVVRDVPGDVAAALPDAALDMTPSIEAATAAVCVRDRSNGVTWLVAGTSEPRVDTIARRPEVVVECSAVLDPRTAAWGRPLDTSTWDVSARAEFVGGTTQRGLRTDTPARCALVDGHVYIAYRNRSGVLSLDVDQTTRSLAGSARLDPARAVFEVGRPNWRSRATARRPATLRVPFRGVATCDDTVLEGQVVVGRGRPTPARVVARPDGAWLEAQLVLNPGARTLQLNFQGRSVDSGLDLVGRRRGRSALVTRASTGPRLRRVLRERGVGGLLRALGRR